MIVKHLYYFTRFWMGLILSIVLPILFVLLSLLIIKFDDTETTTVRNLTLVLPDLAEESSNITFFWAKFGSNFPIYFGVCVQIYLSFCLTLSLSLCFSLSPLPLSSSLHMHALYMHYLSSHLFFFSPSLPSVLQADNASLIQATDFFDFTSDIESIRSSVTNITSVDKCCNYNYQILDKYCASRTAVSVYSDIIG